jgi:hypothetical protein
MMMAKRIQPVGYVSKLTTYLDTLTTVIASLAFIRSFNPESHVQTDNISVQRFVKETCHQEHRGLNHACIEI